MNEIVINETTLSVKEYNGQRVITFKDIDTVHGRPDGTAKRNFNKNRHHFIENVDYFKIDRADEIRTVGIERPQGGTPESVILLTETGYLMIAKSLTDDLAWTVQRQLVNAYFKLKEKTVTEQEQTMYSFSSEEVEKLARLLMFYELKELIENNDVNELENQ